MKHILKVMALGLLFLFSACASKAKLTLSESNITIKEGEKFQVEVSVEPEKLLSDVVWKSASPEIASVENGLIEGIKEGSAVITATVKGITVSLKVTVTKAQDVFVIFNTLGGSEIETKTIKEGSLLIKPEDPEMKGHSFTGWYIQEALITLFDFSKPIDKNTTLYAGWRKNDVIITLNTMGGTPLEAITLGYNDVLLEADLLLEVSKEGHTFKGWFLDEDLTEPVIYDVPVTENFTVYANWEKNTYSVTFDLNNDEPLISIEVDYDELIEIASPEKEGFEFDGWFKDEALSLPFDIAKDTVKEDMTLYAKWKYGNVTVTFVVNMGTPVPKMVLTTMDVIETIPTTTRQNYIFSGWYKDSEFQNLFDFTLPITEDTTIYALWTYDETVGAKVSFELNGGTFLLSSTDFFIKYGRTPIKTFKTNIVYNGNPWTEELYKDYVYLNPTLNTGSYWVKTGFARNEHGVYEAIRKVASGSIDSTGLDFVISAWPQSGAPYTFANSLKLGDIVTLVGQDIATVELGEKIPYGTLNIYPSGSVYEELNTNVVRIGTTLPIPHKEGATFGGWYETEDFSGTAVTKANNSGTLYAKWD